MTAEASVAMFRVASVTQLRRPCRPARVASVIAIGATRGNAGITGRGGRETAAWSLARRDHSAPARTN